MKWFKHGAKSLSDEVIFEAIARFRSDGYLVFFGTLELMADEFDIYNPGVKTFSWKFLKKNLQLSRQKLIKIYSFFDEKARENRSKNKGFLINYDDEGITINCKKLAKLSDEHTRKLLNKAQDELRSKSGVSQAHRSKKKEVRSKKKEKDIVSPPKKGDPRVKEFIDHYQKRFEEIFGSPPFITWAKDGKLIKGLLQVYELDQLKGLLEAFFTSDDEWLRDKGYTIGIFASQINKFVVGNKAGGGFVAAKMWLKMKEDQDGRTGQNQVFGHDAKNEGKPALPD